MSSHQALFGWPSSVRITSNQREPPSGQVPSGSWSWKVSESRLRQTTLKYAAAAESAGWVKSQFRSVSWPCLSNASSMPIWSRYGTSISAARFLVSSWIDAIAFASSFPAALIRSRICCER